MRGRDAHRSPGIGAEGAGAQPRRDRRARAARRPARDAIHVPRIAHGTGPGDRRRPAIGELVHVELAQDDCARRLEPRHHLGVLIRDAVREHRARRRRQHPRRIDVVLQRDRNAVQRTAPPAPRQLRLERPRALDGALLGHRHEGVELRVQTPDARDVGLHEIQRREVAAANEALRLGDAQVGRIGGLRERRTARQARGRGCARREEVASGEGCRHVMSSDAAASCRNASGSCFIRDPVPGEFGRRRTAPRRGSVSWAAPALADSSA